MNRRQTLAALFAAGLVTSTALPAFAQAYPGSNTITFIVPFSPGGGTDLASRILTERLGALNGWTVIVDNRPGAGGTVGLSQLSRAAPDGLTLAMGQTSNLAINPNLHDDISYDPLTDFTPIAIINQQPTVIVVPANSPYETLADLVEAARTNPGNIAMATPGIGTVAHLTLELFGSQADVEFLHIPYPGATQAVTDAVAGHVDFAASSLPSALSQIRAGGVRALAVTSIARNDAVPDVVTVAESGYPDFDAGDWKAVVGPAGLSPEIVAALSAAITTALEDEGLRANFATDGSIVVGGSPEDLDRLIRSEHARWATIIEESDITAD